MTIFFSNKITQIVAVIAGVVGLASISGCGNSGGNSCGDTTPALNATAITIDNAGVIPVFGNSSTSTVVYVHNNTNHTISGISYSAVTNSAKANSAQSNKLAGILKTNKSLVTVDGSQCSTIAAGQSCPLAITTPVLSDDSSQGSIQIKASYSLNNKSATFSQLINYAKVQNNLQTNGAKFQAGIDISAYGNSTGYATIYLYGSGQNQVYNVSSMTINKPAVTIVNGNISGHQIQSNFVQAVEVSSPALNSSLNATITVVSAVQSTQVSKTTKKTVKSLLTDTQFRSSVDLAVASASAGAILTTGLVPLINTVNGTSGSMVVQNSGNQNAVLGSVSAGSGISGLAGCSNATLAPAAVCTITFSVTESGGSANITIPYNGGSATSVVGNVTWYNGIGAALVAMAAANNPLSFSATVGGSTTVTVTNIGGYTLNNITIPTPVVLGGSASATLANNTCASVESLPIGNSCSYDVQVADSATDLNQQINLGFSASYAGSNGTQAYSKAMPLTYNSTAYGAIVSISPFNPIMTISGNNLESASQILTISNNGNLPATLNSLVLSNNPAYLTVSTSTCGATLAAESSCTSIFQLGPIFSKTESSGLADYIVNYSAIGQTPAGSTSNTISWTVQAYDQSISLTSQTAFGSTSGDGESEGTQYNFTARGRDLVGKSITLNYTNTGTHAMKITGIQDRNSPVTWQSGGNGTTCVAGIVLAPEDTCKLVYTNVLESNILALGAVGATFAENLSLPQFAYQDVDSQGVQFNAVPTLANSSYTIYAQSHQATLANSITLNESGTINASVTVSHLLANADDALNVTVTTQMEDYFEVAPGENDIAACTSNSANGIMTQTCIMGKDDLSMSETYRINPNYLSSSPLILTALFSLDGLSQIASMNPLAIKLDLGTIPNFVAVGTNGTILYSQDGVSWESTNFGTDYINGVTFADNKYVAVGQNGAVYTSNNAMNWVAQLSGTSQELFEVAYGNNLFVSVGCTGTIITSPTGVNWSLQTGINSCDIYGVTYGNGLYVATGQGGYLQTSPDALTWTARDSSTNEELTAVSYGNGKYIAVGTNGTIVYSTDGITWNPASSGVSAQVGAVVYANNQYVAVTREGGIITSGDGVNWSSQTSNNLNPLYGIAYAQGKFVAVGTNGTILTSIDAITWETQNSNTTENLYGIASVH